MELKELTDKMIDLLGIKNINEMSERLFEVVTQNDNEIYDKFCKLVENDLTVDWLQMIYQYYQADRKEKKNENKEGSTETKAIQTEFIKRR